MAKTKTRPRQPPTPVVTPPEKKYSVSRPVKPKSEKPEKSWLLILIEAFKHDYETTLTYKETELFEWIVKAYPYYASQNPEFWHSNVKRTLNNYEVSSFSFDFNLKLF
ncbi:2276_t:CDS:1 [Ambispora leptoticha]|uniref:2276_t:CDS:1 n=1 Tax=Ambispora leptoticha TaxID=144679 RepID=A0A9N9FAW0_9GLOM|nr:2276_t:CDS:1 [Ambispora leptoticha]